MVQLKKLSNNHPVDPQNGNGSLLHGSMLQILEYLSKVMLGIRRYTRKLLRGSMTNKEALKKVKTGHYFKEKATIKDLVIECTFFNSYSVFYLIL